MKVLDGYTDLFNRDISGWNVSSVTNMSGMFNGAKLFNIDISNWDVHNVQNMNFMFSKTESFCCDLSKWDVSNVKYYTGVFDDNQLMGRKRSMHPKLKKKQYENIQFIRIP